MRLILFNEEEGYIDGSCTQDKRTTTLKCINLKPGVYYLITHADF